MALAGVCKRGRVKSGPNKGRCKLAPGKKRSTKLTGAAARAKACKGQKGEYFRACLESPRVASMAMDGLRRRRSRR